MPDLSGTAISVKGRQFLATSAPNVTLAYVRIQNGFPLVYRYLGYVAMEVSGGTFDYAYVGEPLWYQGVWIQDGVPNRSMSLVCYWRVAGIPFEWLLRST